MPRRKTKTHPGYKAPFAVRLRELIDAAAIPQSALADYIGVTRQAVSAYSLGTSVPDIDKFERIANYFDVSTEYLLGRTDIKKADASKQAAAEYLGLSEDAIDAIKEMQNVHFELNLEKGCELAKPEEPLPEIFSHWLGTVDLSKIMSDIWQMICAAAQDNGWSGWNKKKWQLGPKQQNAIADLEDRGYLVLSSKQQTLFFGQSASYKFTQSLRDMTNNTILFVKEQDYSKDDGQGQEVRQETI